MFPRRAAPLALLLALAACAKEVKQGEPQATLVFAAFASDATNPAYLAGTPGPKLPQPSDLALQAAPLLPASAQKELLQAFAAAGGFPSDQEVSVTIPVRAVQFTGGAYVAAPVPDVDTTTVAANALVLKVDGASAVAVPFEVAGYAKSADGLVGTITLRKQDEAGSRRWAPGRYVVALRGGASGVKTTGGLPLAPDQAIALVSANRDLSQRENQPPGGLSAAQVQSLEGLRATLANPLPWCNMAAGWLPVTSAAAAAACTTVPVAPSQSAFAAVSAHFPLAEVASIQTFSVAPAHTVVLIDAGSGVAPLPIDLLRTGPGGTIALNPAFGPAAAGLTTLDGFSTTAMMLAQTSFPLDASTVHGGNVFLYKLDPAGGTPTRVRELKAELGAAAAGSPTANPAAAGYVAEPTPITVAQGQAVVPNVPCAAAGGCSMVVGLQPAVTAPTQAGTFHLPPLDESSTYAVVVTSRVKDMLGNSLAKPTVAKILLDVTGALHDASRPAGQRSLLAGVNDTTALALQTMRAELAPVMTALGADLANVVSAYTFKTQSITAPALQFAAIPYNPAGPAAVQASTSLTPAQASAQYGIDAAFLPSGPAGPLAGFAEVKLNTTSLLLASQNAGAFDPAHPAPEVVTALVAIPNPALVTGTCPAGRGFTAAKCAPLAVFRHGITRSKADLLPIAANLAARGFVAVAIDSEKHGDRSYCTSDAQCCPAALCGTASTCAFKTNFTTPVDQSASIGVCESAPGVRGSYLNFRVDCASEFLADGVTPNPACLSPKGIPYVSANYLVSMNFFRTRDTLRQDIIDQSALIAALAPPQKSADAFAAALEADHGLAVNPDQIYWVSQSLGSIQGAVDVAVNPRITRAVLNVGGATITDIFANPQSAFHARLLGLIAPIQENSSEYLKLLQVAKWILDPADPANFARHVTADILPSPLGTAFPAPASREVLTQTALCDGTVPNAQNTLLTALLGIPVPTPGAAGSGRAQWYVNTADTAASLACPGSAGTTSHGFLLDGSALTLPAQTHAADFLLAPADKPSTVRP